ncbi:hypothetical protein PAHAL_8G070200 [Panicum hallii]|uniref:Uncharacterized protein n=1 Tax=Panicum hallii TaxID=206008 RepID=A0A2S3IDX7_9POAL|nr:glucuronoxylan 4-O-methyltransferase 2-like [Panicum hallii]PAN41790.1 hypothetical protein PAHAL_8G070200 [Panicum hallii]
MTSPVIARKAKLRNHLVSAKAKLKHHVTPRRLVLLAAAGCSVFLVLLTLRTLHSAARAGDETIKAAAAASTPAAGAGAAQHAQQPQPQQQQRECAKLPASVTGALVHYATSNETPRQTEAEAGAAARVLAGRAPCNLLVFGLGPDAALWAALNHGGRTLFLEADAGRIAAARAAHPAGVDDLEAHLVAYHDHQHASATVSGDGLLALVRNSSDCAAASPPKPLSPDHLERSPCALAPRGLPPAFYEAEWDVIMVGAPVPGAIYTAGVAARARRPGTGETDVLVHGVDGAAEESFARAFLCEGYIKEEAGRLRHFAIPSHRDKEAMPFCP